MERVKNGEKVYAIADEHGRHAANIYGLLKRRYGYAVPRVGYWPESLTIPPTVAERSYIAGLIDGEGSIYQNERGLWIVKIGMTDKPVMDWFASFGGCYQTYVRRNPLHKTVYLWSTARRADVLMFLEAIVPYMRVKRVKAEQCLAELQARPPQRPGRKAV